MDTEAIATRAQHEATHVASRARSWRFEVGLLVAIFLAACSPGWLGRWPIFRSTSS